MDGGCSERIDTHSLVPMIKNSFTLSLLPEMKFSRWFSSSLQPPVRTSNTQPFSKLQCCQNSVRSDSSKTRKPWTHSNRAHAFHCFENTETFRPSLFQFTPTISVDLSDKRPVSIAIIAGLDAVCIGGLTLAVRSAVLRFIAQRPVDCRVGRLFCVTLWVPSSRTVHCRMPIARRTACAQVEE